MQIGGIVDRRAGTCVQGSKAGTYFTFHLLGTLAFQNSVAPIQQEVSEMVDFMALPILNAALQFVDSFEASFFAESFVGSA